MKLIRKLGTKFNKNGKMKSFALFWCEHCNQEIEKEISDGKKAKSCGCYQFQVQKDNKNNYIHGGSYTQLYHVWNGIKNRCLNPNNDNYKHYGGKGITICDEWLNFIPFRDWSLNNGYSEGLTIDRINNYLGYIPSNCRWATQEENHRNTTIMKLNMEKVKEIRIKYNSGYYTQKQLANEYTISIIHVHNIVNNKVWKDI